MSVAHHSVYSPRLYRRAQLSTLILALLGVMTFTAVRELAGQCRTEYGCLATSPGSCLATGPGLVLATGILIGSS